MADASSPIRHIDWQGRTAVVTVAGDIDMARSKAFQAALTGLVDENPQRIVVDLSGVEYMDSSGVASLVKLHTQTKKIGASMGLAQVGRRVMSIFEIMRLNQLFHIYDTLDDALASDS
jgi:anti-sigma B factor antagonist